MRRRILVIGAGLALGAALALAGVAAAPDREMGSDEPTTTAASDTPAGPSVWWHDPHETVIAGTALILESLVAFDGELALTYRLEPVSPAPMGVRFFFSSGDEEHHPVAPEVWVLETSRGDIEGVSARAHSTEVRFLVPDGLTFDDVTGLRLERHRIRVPYAFDVALPPERDASMVVDTDVSLIVAAILVQRSSVSVGIGVERPHDPFIAGYRSFAARGISAAWDAPSPRGTSGTITDAVQLAYDAQALPERMDLQVVGALWVPVERSIRLDLGGVRRVR